MSKKTNKTAAETKNNNMEEIMEQAMVNVEVKDEVKEEVQTEVKEVKQKRTIRTFKNIILTKIDLKAKNLPDYVYDPIRDQIAMGMNLLQEALDSQKKKSKTEKSIHKKLSKFTVEQIQEYLEAMKLD